MDKKYRLLIICTAILFLGFVGTASAKTWYVDDDGGANFTKIQEAIDAASPGDTVFVWNGTYYEDGGVSITEDKITLQGEDANTTIIHGKWTAEKVVYVTGTYVNVSGFTAAGSTSEGYGIYVEGNNCIISDNIIIEGHNGIYLSGSDNSILSHNNASDCYYGIHLFYSSNNTIADNIANSSHHCGIWLYCSSNCTLGNNTANSNYSKYYSFGIQLSSSSNCTLENNTANSNYYYGIYLSYSSNCTLENNTANSNNINGICLLSSSNNHIIGNTADVNEHGIHLEQTSTNNNITNNNVTNNEYGMYLDWSGNNEIYHNNFINNEKQAYDHRGFNNWDKGPIIGGNYWSDHVCHGNPSNGSEPYTKIDTNAGAVDNYPFEDPDGWVKAEKVFDTGPGTYPSIFGTHTGKIKPNHDIIVNRMYTYACPGTGGHTEYVRFENESWNITVNWTGYQGDWHNITFDDPFTLYAGFTYNYTIRTGSYPRIHHNMTLIVPDGEITCTQFTDANGKRYDNWIPAIKLASK